MKYSVVISRFFFVIVCAMFCAFSLSGAPVEESYSEVVATTSWTGAFAMAAGAEDVHVLAPYEMRHPPEYELSPSDIAVLTHARYIVFAGYEGSVPRIKEAIGESGPELIQIATDFSPETLGTSINRIASILDTVDAANRSITEISSFYEDWRNELSKLGFSTAEVITHLFHRPLAVALGMNVIGVYGPAPLEARQIVSLSELPARFIIDNHHNDVGKPLRETMGRTTGASSGTATASDTTQRVPVAELINFPGTAGTVTLMDVLRENRRRLYEVLN